MAMTLKTIRVPDLRDEYDLFWGLFFRGQATFRGYRLLLVGDALPVVLFPDSDSVRLRWAAGGVKTRKGVVSLRADEVDLSDDRIRQLTRTGTVDLFSTGMGQFVLNFGTGDARPRLQRTTDSLHVDWPNAVPRVDVPWWPFDPAISHVEAFANRRVKVSLTSGLSVVLEFV